MNNKVGKKPVIALVVIVVIILAGAIVLTQIPAVNLLGTLSDESAEVKTSEQSTKSSINETVDDALVSFNKVNKDGETFNVNFDAHDAKGAENIDNNVSSHIQGYARYRGSGYDYHIFPYSNLSGQQGYVWFVSDSQRFHIDLSLKIEQYNPDAYFNHPTGLQIIGDYLVVAVIPADGELATADFHKPSYTYVMDISSLKSRTPITALNVKQVNYLPNIKDVKGEETGSLSCVGAADLNGRFLIAYVSDNTLVIYESDKSDNIWDATNYKLIRTYDLDRASDDSYHYQSIGLYKDNDGHIYMVGLDKRQTKNDYADLFKLTTNVSSGDVELIGDKSSVHNFFIKEKHVYLKDGPGFEYGGGIEVFQNQLYIYASESYAKDGNATVNVLNPED